MTEFNLAGISLRPIANEGVQWSLTGANAVIKGDFSYTKKFFLWNTKIRGQVSVRASQVSVHLLVKMQADQTTGRPVLSGHHCVCNIGKTRVTMKNSGIDWVFNLLTRVFSGTIKTAAKRGICEQAVKTVNKDGNEAMRKLKVKTSVVGPEFELDYRLVDSPAFTSSYMETHHKGEIYWKNDKTRTPLSPTTLPTSADTSGMINVWMSEYVFNTFFHSAFSHKYFKDSVAGGKLNPSKPGFLNTTCIGGLCIGNIVKPIGTMYPDHVVSFDAKFTNAPSVAINPSGIVATFDGEAKFFAVARTGFRHELFRLGANVTATLQATAGNDEVRVSVSKLDIEFDIRESKIGVIPVKRLNSPIQFLSKHYLKPALNKRLFAKGFPIPVSGFLKLKSPKLKLVWGAILVESDVELN